MASNIRISTETFRVGLLITEQCNVECSHCWFSSGPDRRAQMKLDEAIGYIDQAREIPSVEWISFTGGEPFLLPEMLLKLVDYASDRGLYTECVTNCFWARTEEEAVGRLDPLADAGLDVVNISADDFHQSHIPFDRVHNCYEAAKSVGLKVVIMCAVARSSGLTVEEVVRRLDDGEISIVGGEKPLETMSAIAVETGFIPVGRGAEVPEDEWLIGKGSLEGPCKVVLRDVAIDPRGWVLPCCSAAGLAQMARVGNAKLQKLGNLLNAAGKRTLFRVLSAEGPVGLKRLLGSPRANYVNRCHLCHEVLTDPRLGKVL
ncbi:hypothetical protein AC482_06460 [miscellaneous Crenarchaeota group-15 archaeon DG-45]|uniref:Radical SAM core domain-containing protein n=1 Tax=miscellaneous Crenarchaeota group-15 archaeon DG-45 TaxID=1685127 RepID=A0A0M0BM00_9ARCH|nr:MAG: hypothetical protein AC482_06460 [miscellaneous Crenarchaeota group-15 archaeon DG-45]